MISEQLIDHSQHQDVEDVLEKKDAANWIYRGEGAATVVLAYSGSSPAFKMEEYYELDKKIVSVYNQMMENEEREDEVTSTKAVTTANSDS